MEVGYALCGELGAAEAQILACAAPGAEAVAAVPPQTEPSMP
jgi:hypothetical protein